LVFLPSKTIQKTMSIIYRSLQAAFLVVSVTLTTLPLSAQSTEHEKEEIEHIKTREANTLQLRPVSAEPVTEKTVQIAPPTVVNFTERANWLLAHPNTNVTFRNNEEKEEGHPFLPHQPVANPKATEVGHGKNTTGTGGNNEKAATNSPAPLLNFAGLAGDGSVIPPDIKLAVGLTYAMEVTNQSFTIYDKSNGALVSTVDLGTFFNFSQTGNNFLTDPHVLYDAIHGRFLAVIDAIIVGNTGTFILAVSQTNNPTGNWYLYTITGANNDITTADDATLLDFPIMGYNQNWVVLTGDQFTATGNGTTDCIFVMDRASLYAGTLGTIKTFTDANSSQVCPAQTMDTTTLTEYLVQEYNGSLGEVQIGWISGAVGAPAYTMSSTGGTNGVITATVAGVTQTWNDNPTFATQKGSTATIDDDDPRFAQSEVINGSFWFAHTAFLPATGTATYSAADWWQINPATLAVLQYGRVSDGSSFYYYPNINANATGDAIVGYTISSTTEYASAAYSFHAAADAVNTMENLYTFKAGVSSYDPTSGQDNRWGDFSGVAIDPVDNSFWVADGWGNTSNNWATQIAHVASSAPITSPPVANFQADNTTSCTGIIQFTDLSSNTPTSWLWTFGDGTTSAVQNPTHNYLTNGTYTVTLKATNAYGNNTQTISSYITINEPAGPAAVGASHCGSGTFSLSATTTNPVKWYNAAGNLLSTSNPFVTPVLTQTTTYYVQDSVPLPYDTAGPKNNTALGTGGYLAPNYGLNFSVLQPGTLESVYINASAAGSVTIFIQNSGGTTVNTTTVNVPAGGSRVTLNFPLTVGTDYLINYSSTITLYRNNAGAIYPFNDANGIVSITGNSAAATGYYYFFYDWYVTGAGCNSQATAVTATVTSGITTSNVAITNVACNGGSTGSAILTPTGGTPAYTYHWSNGQTTATLSGVAAGNYSVTVNDASGCSGTAAETISQPAALNISVTSTGASCGSSTGSASATVSGGTSGYSYLWSNAATAASIANLAPATYTLTVTDAHSCSGTGTATITSSGGLNLTASAVDAACFGTATGSATIAVTGGSGNATYHWSNGGAAATISNVAAGTYTVTVSETGGCSGTASQTVTEPASALNVTATATNSGCGSPNGTATATASGGTSSYSYEWSNTANTAAISGLSAATYTVTVTDNHQCTASTAAVVNNSGILNISTSPNVTNCSGGSTGGASATVNGGTAPFAYHWSNGTTTAAISGVTAGTYTVTISDNTGCSGTSSVVVALGSAIGLTSSLTNVKCFNESNGSASVNVTAGTSPYSYAWNNGSTASSISNLSAGTYYVTVTDARSCIALDSAIVSQPASITIFVSTVQPTCSGLNNGSATVSASGGTPSYSYNWSTSTSGTGVNSLAPGSYSVSLTDANNCTSSSNFSITNPPPVSASVIAGNDSCFGSSDGDVQLTPAGGTSPYAYLWSNNSTSATVTNLAAGTYNVTITDVHNCSATTTASITQPAQINVTTSATETANGQSTGSATVSNVTGGVAPFVATWSNGSTGNTITGLAAATYTVTITDHNGCESTATATVSNSVGIISVNSDLSFTIYPNPAKSEVTIDAGTLDKETTLVLEDILGQTLMSKEVTTTPVNIDLNNYANGVYFVELRQGNKRSVKKLVISK
jgi:PKD repeat protein